MQEELKTFKLPKELHTKLKMQAAEQGLTMISYLRILLASMEV